VPLVPLPTAWAMAKCEDSFPNLKYSEWSIKSPQTAAYQCIAWAASDTTRRWWPLGQPPMGTLAFWPPNVPKEETVDCFMRAFATLGYRPCNKPTFEFGYQRVAIYADQDGTPTHMARQHFMGRGWLSKLGDFEDILHPELRNVEGDAAIWPPRGYGAVVQIMKRSWWTAARYGLFRGWWAALKFWVLRLSD
jgi:hypothetical protein